MKTLLFSVTLKDCDVQTFRGSGAGGQKRNKTSSGIRIVHRESGAVGQASDAREQSKNKRTAFLRMIQTKEFTLWQKITTQKILGQLPKKSIDELVDEALVPENIKFECKIDDKWVETEFSDITD